MRTQSVQYRRCCPLDRNRAWPGVVVNAAECHAGPGGLVPRSGVQPKQRSEMFLPLLLVIY